MTQGFAGWHVLLFFYPVMFAIAAVALYFVIRFAVLHALKSHTRWLDQGKP
ncbi:MULTISPECIES: hypothetical protein [unclassified Microbacterium]|uniref:hypothetical protein n=1 Tax=unclassified Microbacterium TaxID=2609290 RepID=UPI0037465107